MYEIPSAAGGDEGLEGFSVLVGDRRVGRVAAVNRAPEGIVLVADTGDAYRMVPAALVSAIETHAHVVRLTDEGEQAFAQSAAIEPRISRTDSPQLVRHIPRELDRLIVPGERAASRHSRLWYVGAVLVWVGGIGVMAGPILTVQNVGGPLRWLWVLVPLAVLALGAVAFWTALGRDSPRSLSRREKLADSLAAIFGISPRTRRRG